MATLCIDNYDSFTYNIVQYLQELGADVHVYRNDAITLEMVEGLKPARIVISPGPGAPSAAGVSNDVIRAWAGRVPILGVCLGLQCMYEIYGGVVTHAGEIVHGKTSDIEHDGRGVFEGLPSPFKAVRYHSLAGTRATLPPDLEVTATSPGGIIQGVRHRRYVMEGVQFHPESILTQHGHDMFRNFLGWKGGMRVSEEGVKGPLAILSTLPAATTIVYALGAQGALRGVSHECEFPPPAAALPRLLTTTIPPDASSADIDAHVKGACATSAPLYTLNEPLLASTLPQRGGSGRLVVLTQDLCDVCAPGTQLTMDALARLGVTGGGSGSGSGSGSSSSGVEVVPLRAASLDGLMGDIERVAATCGVEGAGRVVVQGLRERVERVKGRVAALSASPAFKRPRVACVEWLDPLYNAGHWVPELVALAGGEEVWGKPGEFSMGLEFNALAGAAPDIIILMPCGFDITRTVREAKEVLPVKVQGWASIPAVAAGRVWAVHGNRLFSGASPALVEGLEALLEILHGEGVGGGLDPMGTAVRVDF